MSNMRQIIKRGKTSLRMADGGGLEALDRANYFSSIANRDTRSIAMPQIQVQPIQMSAGGDLSDVDGMYARADAQAAYDAELASARRLEQNRSIASTPSPFSPPPITVSQGNFAGTAPANVSRNLRMMDNGMMPRPGVPGTGTTLPATGAGAGRGTTLPTPPGQAPTPTIKPGAPSSQIGPNAFGDNTSGNSSFNPQQSKLRDGTTMQAWSTPGRSNGQPNAQDMAAVNNIGNPANSMFASTRLAAQPNTINPLGDPNRGMKAVQPGSAIDTSRFAAPAFGTRQPITMADGGMFDSIKRAVGMAPAETMREKFARQDAERAAKAPQPVAPAPAAPAPQIAAPMGSQSVMDRREKAAGLRDGGDLRTGHGGQLRENPVGEYMRRVGEEWSRSNADFEGGNPGVMQRVGRAVNPLTGFGSGVGAMYDAAGSGDVTGMALAAGASIPVFAAARTAKTVAGPLRAASTGGTAVHAGQNTAVGVGADYYTPGLQDGGMVPGTGEGDKIPAKYEPGEFVVSNDMLDAQPELRPHLRALREAVLAEKGMTPEQADMKALNGGKGLRAEMGVDDWARLTSNELAKGQNVVDTYAGQRSPEIRSMVADTRTAMQQPAGEAARYAGVKPAPVVAAPHMGPNAGPSNAQARGYKFGRNAAGAIRSTAGRAIPIVSGGFDVAQGIEQRDGWQVAKGAGDMVAGAALATPFAPAAGLYLGGRALYESGKAIANGIGEYMSENSDNVQKINSMYGKAASAGARPTLRGGNEFDAANKAKMAAFEAENPSGPAKLGDIRNIDNEAGTQDVFTRGAWTTVSTPEAKQRQALRDEQYSQRLRDDAVASRADTARQLAYFEGERQKEQEAHMFDGLGRNHRAAAMNQYAQTKASLRNAQLSSDTTLEATRMNNETSLASSRATNKLGMHNALREQANKDREFNAGRSDKMFETSGKMDEQARNALKFYGRDKDGKPFEDTEAQNMAYELAMRNSGGQWSQANPQQRAALLSDARDHVSLLINARDHQNNSIWQAVGLGRKDAMADHLPALKGARLEKTGFIEGVATPNAERGDYKLITADGKVMYLGRDKVGQGQLAYMKRNGVHIGE